MKILMGILFVSFMGCVNAPRTFLDILDREDISYNSKDSNFCTMKAVNNWEAELHDQELYENFRKYLNDKEIKHINLKNVKNGSKTCDFIILSDGTREVKTSPCDPSTVVLEGSMNLPQTKISLKRNTLTIESYTIETFKNEYVYRIYENTDEHINTLIELFTDKKDNLEFISFDKVNDYSFSFPIEIMSRDYHNNTKCSGTKTLAEIIAE